MLSHHLSDLQHGRLWVRGVQSMGYTTCSTLLAGPIDTGSWKDSRCSTKHRSSDQCNSYIKPQQARAARSVQKKPGIEYPRLLPPSQ